MRPLKFMITAVMPLFMVLFLISSADAFFRLLCKGEVGVGRIDPIISPNRISQHVHGIHGAQNMALEVTTDMLMASNCTSCAVRQDKSAYWSPYMYFQHENGTFQMVPKVGGLTAYYFTEKPADMPDSKIVAFPAGFRMMAGNTFRRAKWDTVAAQVQPPNRRTWSEFDKEQQQRAGNMVGFNCLHYNGGYNEDSLGRHFMPDKGFIDTNCPNGIRAEIMFPSCWNGELDSPNHMDHVAYPRDARNGPCPPGYGKRLPALFFETIYDTGLFADFKGQFVYANGDPTGYGYHGDFISGWEGTTLQDAIDNTACTSPNSLGNQEDCPIFSIKEEGEYVSCKMETPEALQNEKIDLIDNLPGGVKVYAGPGWAPVPDRPVDPAPIKPDPLSVPAAASSSVSATSTSASLPGTVSADYNSTSPTTPFGGTGTAIIPATGTASATATSPGSDFPSHASTASSTSAADYEPLSPPTPPFSNTSVTSNLLTSIITTTSDSLVPDASLQTLTNLSTDAAGIVVQWVIVQEIDTTTVYVDSAGRTTEPPAPASTYPLQPVKRHRHRHNHVRVHL